IKDPQQAAEHVLRILDERALVSVSGKRIPAEVDTFCIHGDEPTAVAVATAVVAALKQAGIQITPLPELIQ
ncbi:MAG TPA: LamB/YcsF family protein, partial [Burkholderiaceae bacterium]|nr:LamB/YcsF family protein [Burkholderiaceae bacterium]